MLQNYAMGEMHLAKIIMIKNYTEYHEQLGMHFEKRIQRGQQKCAKESVTTK